MGNKNKWAIFFFFLKKYKYFISLNPVRPLIIVFLEPIKVFCRYFRFQVEYLVLISLAFAKISVKFSIYRKLFFSFLALWWLSAQSKTNSCFALPIAILSGRIYQRIYFFCSWFVHLYIDYLLQAENTVKLNFIWQYNHFAGNFIDTRPWR